jgi:hypothetical protein
MRNWKIERMMGWCREIGWKFESEKKKKNGVCGNERKERIESEIRGKCGIETKKRRIEMMERLHELKDDVSIYNWGRMFEIGSQSKIGNFCEFRTHLFLEGHPKNGEISTSGNFRTLSSLTSCLISEIVRTSTFASSKNFSPIPSGHTNWFDCIQHLKRWSFPPPPSEQIILQIEPDQLECCFTFAVWIFPLKHYERPLIKVSIIERNRWKGRRHIENCQRQVREMPCQTDEGSLSIIILQNEVDSGICLVGLIDTELSLSRGQSLTNTPRRFWSTN